jgi:hypothetical protein
LGGIVPNSNNISGRDNPRRLAARLIVDRHASSVDDPSGLAVGRFGHPPHEGIDAALGFVGGGIGNSLQGHGRID